MKFVTIPYSMACILPRWGQWNTRTKLFPPPLWQTLLNTKEEYAGVTTHSESKEKVRIRCLRNIDDGSVRFDQLKGRDCVDGQAVLVGLPGVT